MQANIILTALFLVTLSLGPFIAINISHRCLVRAWTFALVVLADSWLVLITFMSRWLIVNWLRVRACVLFISTALQECV